MEEGIDWAELVAEAVEGTELKRLASDLLSRRGNQL